jgi:staphylococcal nuclease domain-containing protein 1
VITALTHNRAGPPPEKTITLSSLMAPKMVSFVKKAFLFTTLFTNKSFQFHSYLLCFSLFGLPLFQARRGGIDEPFAWESREFLRKLCIGKEVAFKVDYKVEAIAGREFGSVYLGNENLAKLVVQNGWAKVRRPGQQNQDKVSPYIAELEQLEEQAQQEGFGRWSKVGVS